MMGLRDQDYDVIYLCPFARSLFGASFNLISTVDAGGGCTPPLDSKPLVL